MNSSSLSSLLMILLGITTSAHADLIRYDVDFSADGFQTAFGQPVPTDPVVGSFSVVLDPDVAVFNSTSNVTLNSINIDVDFPLSFTYTPFDPDGSGVFTERTLRVGGSFSGSDIVQFRPPTNDFWLFINDFTQNPQFLQLGYSQTSIPGTDVLFFTPQNVANGSTSITATNVPEPSTVVLTTLYLEAVACGSRIRSPREYRKQA